MLSSLPSCSLSTGLGVPQRTSHSSPAPPAAGQARGECELRAGPGVVWIGLSPKEAQGRTGSQNLRAVEGHLQQDSGPQRRVKGKPPRWAGMSQVRGEGR